ncbi:MAG: PilZ domain-containing protein [Myxococcota bacterium]|jgi:uncharacterized protein (TIGR02266 family)
MNDERRQTQRLELGIRCWCEGVALAQYVHISDINTGGFFVRTHTPFGIGERVKVRWGFPQTPEEYEASMLVVWKRENARSADVQPGMGLKFLSVAPEAQDAIRNFVADRPGTV